MTAEQLDSAEDAIDEEFADYLSEVSREITDPIRESVRKHEKDIDRLIEALKKTGVELDAKLAKLNKDVVASETNLIEKLDKASQRLQSVLSKHEVDIAKSEKSVIDQLKYLSSEMQHTVRSVEAGHEETRQKLLSTTEDMRKDQAQQIKRIFSDIRSENMKLTQDQVNENRKQLQGQTTELLDELRREYTTKEIAESLEKTTHSRLLPYFKTLVDHIDRNQEATSRHLLNANKRVASLEVMIGIVIALNIIGMIVLGALVK